MGADATAAVAALAAAGKDTEALMAAIKGAAFLDSTPGESRQKLRGEAVAEVSRLAYS